MGSATTQGTSYGYDPSVASMIAGTCRCHGKWIVRDCLAFGLVNRSPRTVELIRYRCETHVIPALGARRLQTLTPAHVETWLQVLTTDLSKRTIQIARSCLSRSIRRAMQRDLAGRNVAELTQVPAGRGGCRRLLRPPWPTRC